MNYSIKTYQGGTLISRPTLLKGLGLAGIKSPVVSFIGAGGKTTLISRLAEEYRSRGIPVIVTTTTHMMIWKKPWFLVNPSLAGIKSVLSREGMAWLGKLGPQGKLCSLPEELLSQVMKLKCPVLIEADGAKRRPMKAPALHEPVILPETTHVQNVYGLDALGKSLEEVCFRTDRAAELLGKEPAEKVEPGDVVKLALDFRAGKKDIPAGMCYGVVLNKADTPSLEAGALEICRLAQEKGFSDITVTAEGRRNLG